MAAFKRMNGDSSEAELSIEDHDSSGKKRTYKVNHSNEPLCNPSVRLKRHEIVCIIIGGVILAVAVLIFIVIAVALSSNSPGTATNNQTNQSNQTNQTNQSAWTNIRLPTNLAPQLYRIALDPDMTTFTVRGSVSIDISVLESTDTVILHVKDMTIRSVNVTRNSALLSVENQFFYPENDFYVIVLTSTLNSGDTVQLDMTFNYTLRNDLVGFYRSSYTLENGETHYLATTQFEPTDARRAFPCFDEPDRKANFSITLTHPDNYQAVSNMPVLQTSKRDTTQTTIFQTSYRMSTYLVAFVVSDFECSSPSTVNGHIKVRVCARSDVFPSTAYAQSVVNIVIGYYEQFFGVPYPLPKQDLFAIPDFAAGAMENWGLITYRETALLYNDTENPSVSKQRVAVVIAHEVAHQWFGNLVTMSWWDGLWLNEGFASYVEYIGSDKAEPSWMMLDQFFVDTLQYAFDADGLNWSHPIIQQVNNPDEINGLFDSISYDKGASLIQMLRNFIGNNAFTEGLKRYLNAHKFGNAETHQLWESLNEVSSLSDDLTVSSMMDTWTKQMGYPVVTITASDTQTASVRQTRFFQIPLPDGGVAAASPFNYVWIIPLDYITENGNSYQQKVIKSAQDTVNWIPSSNGFIKANVNQTGFYRVNYDIENWQRLINHLMIPPNSRPNILSSVDRAGLIEDAFALSSAGLLNITVALNLSQYLKTEMDYVPWATALRWFSSISRKLSLTSVYGKYQRYVSSLLTNVIREHFFNVTNLDHLHTFLQTDVLWAGFRVGDQSIADTSLSMFRDWMRDGTSISPNLRLVVYRVAIATGGESEWNFLWNWYLNTSNPYEKQICLSALAQSREPWILNRYLKYSMTHVRSQDTLYVIRSVSRNVFGRYLAWNFFRDNWDTIFSIYGGGTFSFPRLIRTLTESFATNFELQELESFFTEHTNAGSASRAVNQAIEVVRGNIGWLELNQKVIDQWLNEHSFY